ncbi:MAG: cytochrome c maturation protein CcmE domain-containing protein [Candidatus Hodarchaeales archaeon]|jgi:cytochrome c-type biogenesis protein CcmE
MNRKYRNIGIILVLAIVGVAAVFMLLMDTSVPVFSVKEIREHPDPESYLGRRIQLVGNVLSSNDSGFILNDPMNRSDSTYLVFVQSSNVEKPSGFAINKTVLVEGKFVAMDDFWTFKASKISTKCPSKYQS